VNTPTVAFADQKRLRAHFGFTRLPFRKNVPAEEMFDSSSQRDLLAGLSMWLELRGLALVSGPSGVGKSICLRRLLRGLPEDRYHLLYFGQIPTTRAGFLRALCRRLELRPRLHIADMFDDAKTSLQGWKDRHGTWPVLVLDDAEGMGATTLDLVRRLTASELDGDERFAVLLVGTERLLQTLADPSLAPLCNRFAYARTLRAFSIEDTRNYVRFHLTHAEVAEGLVTDDALREIFQASAGVPRAVNQLALQALIDAVIRGLDTVDGKLMRQVIHAHPLYASPAGRP
jgi:type II secretory pathway predicted ATPase ExeA